MLIYFFNAMPLYSILQAVVHNRLNNKLTRSDSIPYRSLKVIPGYSRFSTLDSSRSTAYLAANNSNLYLNSSRREDVSFGWQFSIIEKVRQFQFCRWFKTYSWGSVDRQLEWQTWRKQCVSEYRPPKNHEILKNMIFCVPFSGHK